MRSSLFTFLATATLTLAACAPQAPAPSAPSTGGGSAAQATAAPTTQPSGPAVTLTFAAEGNEARYRVNETLATQVVADAVGSTKGVTGKLVFASNGQLISDQSNITVDVKSLQSDRNSRDMYLRRNTLQSEQFPTVTFVPKSVKGLNFPLPASGEVSFQMTGDLTVRAVTKPVTWDVKATMAGKDATGSAKTTFTFQDFQIEKPSVLAVLSVVDEIRLELDFKVTQAAG